MIRKRRPRGVERRGRMSHEMVEPHQLLWLIIECSFNSSLPSSSSVLVLKSTSNPDRHTLNMSDKEQISPSLQEESLTEPEPDSQDTIKSTKFNPVRPVVCCRWVTYLISQQIRAHSRILHLFLRHCDLQSQWSKVCAKKCVQRFS
jgi:hypothetical protein